MIQSSHWWRKKRQKDTSKKQREKLEADEPELSAFSFPLLSSRVRQSEPVCVCLSVCVCVRQCPRVRQRVCERGTVCVRALRLSLTD